MRELRFSQGFPLNRERLSGMIRSIAEGQAISDEAVGSYMGVNPYMVEGFRGWLCKTGLGRGTSRNYSLSEFGTILTKCDPDLRLRETQWLMHYYLVSQHDERAEVWFRCFNEFLTHDQHFTIPALQDYIDRALEQTPSNRKGVESDTKELIKTYTNSASLGDLSLLTKISKTEITAQLTVDPHPLIVAYVLFDSWERRFGTIDTVRMSQLISEPESIGKVFVADATQVRRFIQTLQSYGFVSFADTQHEPVTRRFHDDPLRLLEQFYQA